MSEAELIQRIQISVGSDGASQIKDIQDKIAGIGETAVKTGSRLGGLVDGLGKIGLASMGLGAISGAAGSAVGAITGLIGSAEGLGDAAARVGLVWGAEMQGVIEDNATVANSLGLTKTAYMDQVGALGQLATSLGVTNDASADMAMGLTELAPKLAAYAGVEGTVASDALEKALAGKTKGLEALGIAITDADKAQAALSLGITGEASKWTEAQTAQVNYAVVMEKTAAAQSAWAGNSSDVEVSMQRVSAAMEDAKATIGEKLLPAIAPLIQAFADKLPGAIDTVMPVITGVFDFLENNPAVGMLVAALGGLAAAFVTVSPIIASAGAVLGGLLPIVGAVAGALTGPLGIAIALIVAAVVILKKAWEQNWGDIQGKVAAVVDWYKANVAPKIEAGIALIKQAIADLVAKWADAWENKIRPAIQTFIDWWSANVGPIIAATVAEVGAILGGIVTFFQENWDSIMQIVSGAMTIIEGYIDVGWAVISGIFNTALALLRGDWEGAWNSLKKTVSDVWDGVKKTLGGFGATISGVVSIVRTEAGKIGTAIVDGIKGTLTSAWDGLVKKLGALVDLLPQTVRDLLGIASPSKIFAQIGEWITIGLASGIQKADQKAVEALANIVGKMTSVANGLADFGQKLAAMVTPTDAQIASAKEKYIRMTLILTDFIKSVSYLGALLPVSNVSQAAPGQIKAINAGLIQLSQSFPAIAELRGMVAENLLTGGEASWASQLADTVGKIAGVWGGLADNMTKMASAVFPSDAQLDQLKESTIRIALWAADSLKNGTLPSAGAAEFAASMKSITDALNTVAGLNLADVAAVTEKQLGVAADNISKAGEWAYSMLAGPDGWLAKAGTSEARAAWIASLKDFQDTVSAATGILRAGDVGDLSEIAEVTNEQLRILGANIAKAGEWAWSLMMGPDGWLATAPSREDRARWIADLKDFADTIGAAVAVAKAAAIGELKAEVEADVIEIRAVLNWVRVNLMPDMIAVAAAWKETAEKAKEQTEHMQTFASWLSAAIGLAKVADIGTLKGDIEADVIELRAVLNWVKNNLAKEMQDVADAWEVTSEKAALMSERMQTFGGWISAVVGLAKVADIGTLKGDIEADAIELRAVLNWVKNNLAPDMVKIADAWSETVKDGAKPMVEKMQAFATFIKAAVDLAKAADIGTLATVTSAADLGAKLEIVKANILAVFGLMGQLAKDITTAEAVARADLAEALGRGMKAIGDFGGGVTSLMDLAESKLFGSTEGTAGLGFTQRTRTRRADFFAQQLRDTVIRSVKALQDALAGITITVDDPKTTALAQLGDAFGKLAAGLKELADTKLPDAVKLAALVAALNGGTGGLALAGVGGAGGGAGGMRVANVTADTATIGSVALGGVYVTASVNVDGRSVASGIVDAMIDKVEILDRLGKALNERAARRP